MRWRDFIKELDLYNNLPLKTRLGHIVDGLLDRDSSLPQYERQMWVLSETFEHWLEDKIILNNFTKGLNLADLVMNWDYEL